jgi:hypothetical protein
MSVIPSIKITNPTNDNTYAEEIETLKRMEKDLEIRNKNLDEQLLKLDEKEDLIIHKLEAENEENRKLQIELAAQQMVHNKLLSETNRKEQKNSKLCKM